MYSIVCFLIKEPRPVDLGLQIYNFTKFGEFNDIYWLFLPTPVIFNVLESTQTRR
jgi:hypothetical protein